MGWYLFTDVRFLLHDLIFYIPYLHSLMSVCTLDFSEDENDLKARVYNTDRPDRIRNKKRWSSSVSKVLLKTLQPQEELNWGSQQQEGIIVTFKHVIGCINSINTNLRSPFSVV